jgi:shikimate kinase
MSTDWPSVSSDDDVASRDDGSGKTSSESLAAELTKTFEITVAELWDRLGESGFRALESAVSDKRAGEYQEAADHVIDTSGKTITQVADEIVSLWAS